MTFPSLRNLYARLVAPWRPQGERGFPVPRGEAGVWVTEDSALKLSAVWACVRLISQTIAALPWRAYLLQPDGGREPLHGTVDWLLHRQPNPEMTAFTFRQVLVSHALLWGNGYAEIERDAAGRPSWLWPLLPDRVTVRRAADGRIVYDVSGDGAATTLQASDVFHLKGLGFDGLTGYSPIRMAASSVGLGLAAETYGARLFRNGAKMGGILEMPGKFKDPETARKVSESFDKATSGDNAHKTVVLEEGARWHQVTIPPDDAQFLETRKFQVSEIARWYGVPPHKIGDLERATFSNIEQQAIEFVQDAIVPWVVPLEQEADLKLFGRNLLGRAFTKFTLQSLLRGDAASRGVFYRQLFDLGALSPNEVRGLEEMNGIGDVGDEHFVQTNLQTLERAAAEPEPPKPAAAPMPGAEPMPDGEEMPGEEMLQ